MRIFKQILSAALLLILLFLIISSGRGVFAKTVAEIQSEIKQYQSQITKLNSQAKTFQNQIAQFNAQIKLTELKIEGAKEKIQLLGGRIDQLEGSLDSLTVAFSTRATETYKMVRLGDPAIFLLSSPDLNTAVNRYFYLQRIQEADRDLLVRLQEAQNVYQGEKLDQEVLQAEFEEESAKLVSQKVAKNTLLSQTKSDEAKYQSLLAQALAEKVAIEAALVSGVEVGPVKQGDPIALVGNSGYPGCSTGKHLHFEVRNGGSWVDPTGYLSSKSVQDEQNGGNPAIGSGGWPWPIQDTVRITQYYGQTPYSWRYTYSGGIHTGFDMISTTGDVIRAPADGTLFKSSQGCGSSTINIAYIDHGNDLLSFYLHIQ